MKASLALPPSIAGKGALSKLGKMNKEPAPVKKPQPFAALGGVQVAPTQMIGNPANLGDLSVKDIKKSPNLMNAEIKKPLPESLARVNNPSVGPLVSNQQPQEENKDDNKPLQKRFAALRELDNDSDEEEARKAREAFKLRAQKKKEESQAALQNNAAEKKNFQAKFAVIPPFKPKPKNPAPETKKVEEQPKIQTLVPTEKNKNLNVEEMKKISDNTTDKNSGRSVSATSSKSKGLKFSKFRVKKQQSSFGGPGKDNSASDNASNIDENQLESNKTSPKLQGSSLVTPEGGEQPKKLSKFKPGLKKKSVTYQRDKNVPLSQSIMAFISKFFHALIGGLMMLAQMIMDNAPKMMSFTQKFDKKFIQ